MQQFKAKRNRTPMAQSYVLTTHYTFSCKNNRAAVMESQIEDDYFNYLEFADSVISFESQPQSEYYSFKGKTCRYTPDFEVKTKEYISVVEIKDSKTAATPKFQEKKAFLKHYFARKGKFFVVVTEKDIRIGKRAENLRFLQPALNDSPPLDDFEKVKKLVPSGRINMPALMRLLQSNGMNLTFPRRAVAHKLILCDLTHPWGKMDLYWAT